MSLSDLAAAVHYSKGYLGKVETGLKPVNADLARRCDAALDAGGGLAALVAPRSPASTLDCGNLDDGEVWIMVFDPDGHGRFVAINRRQALGLGLVSMLDWHLDHPGAPAALDETAVQRFEAMFTELRSLGRTSSPGAVLPTVVAQATSLRGLAGQAQKPHRGRLLLLAGRYAEYAGWMAQEAGHERAAWWWIDQATTLADAAGDTDLQAYTWVRKAGVMLYRDDAASVVELAHQAQRRPGSSHRIRGLAALREAQGHALAGEYDPCRRALDRAAGLLATATAHPSGALPLGSTSAPDQHALVTGWCMFDLGRPLASADILDRAVQEMPAGSARAAARFGARRALAHAAVGNVERACALAENVLDTATLIDSATVRSDLRQLGRALARWHKIPAVTAVQRRLRQAHRTRPPG